MLYSALPIITIPPASYKQALAPHTSDLISLFSWLQLRSYLKLYFFFLCGSRYARSYGGFTEC